MTLTKLHYLALFSPLQKRECLFIPLNQGKLHYKTASISYPYKGLWRGGGGGNLAILGKI